MTFRLNVRISRRVIAVVVFLVGAGMSGCSALKPSVKPYEREKLADPLMSISRDPISDRYLDHVHDVRESARGAGTSQGGGCGCN